MLFKKEDLKFLNIYSTCIDTKSRFGDKVVLEYNLKNKQAIFYQTTKSVLLITELEIEHSKDIKLTYNTQTLNSLINYLSEDSQIEIDSSLIIDNKSTYNIALSNINISSAQKFFSIVKSNKPEDVIHLKDLDKLKYVKNFMGAQGLDAVALYNQYFIATNKVKVGGIVQTENKGKNLFLSKLLINLISTLKLEELELYDYSSQGFYYFKYNNTYIIIPIEKWIIPNFMSEKGQKYFDHPFEITFSKHDFLQVLQRIEIVTKTNYANRIYLSFKDNSIVLENKDSEYAQEIFNVSIPKELNDYFIIVSNMFLISTLNMINSDEVIMKVIPDKSIPTISILDKEKKQIYIHVLYKHN